MPTNGEYQQSVLWDDVNVLMVNYRRQEMYLYENAGGGVREFHIRTAEAGARANIHEPFEILDMAIRYAVSFDLLFRVLDAEVRRVFEAIGVKDFLNTLIGNTTEQMRRDRFKGLNLFEFTVNVDEQKQAISATEPDDDEAADDELEAVGTPPVTNGARIPKARRTPRAAATTTGQTS